MATFVSAASKAGTASGTSVVVTAPTSLAAGNLLIAIVYAAGSTATAVGAPADWTLIDGTPALGKTAGMVSVYTKTVTASEPASYTFTGTQDLAADVLQYS